MKTDQQPPSEEEIINLLSRIQPHPGERFGQKIAHQPWNRAARVSFWERFTPMRVAASLGLLILFILGVGILAPSLDTVAQRLTQFFAPSSTDRVSAEIEPQGTADPLTRFNMNIAEAEALAGFSMKRPSLLPAEIRLTGATFDELRQAIILNYMTDSREHVLRISQQRLDLDYQRIGPQAVVEVVMIGSYKGEYVSGGWMIPEVKSGVDATVSPSTPEAIWDANVNLQTLRWSDGIFLYEIVLAGSFRQPAFLDKEALITLAENMQ